MNNGERETNQKSLVNREIKLNDLFLMQKPGF